MESESLDQTQEQVLREARKLLLRSLRPVVNATGVLLHTNLGRAPLAEEAVRALQEVSAGYSNLEFDLDTGKRGLRYEHVEGLLCSLTGAESALVVNNNAAAVYLALRVLARGKGVIVSRGELIEIGGSFRIPDILQESDATLVEVGTTNRTHLKDYEQAIGSSTGLLLKVHPSNYRVMGFHKEVSTEELVALGRRYGLPVMEDLGSGCLLDPGVPGLANEPLVADVLRTGVDLVTFSGDKLLGGPQAGIIAGRKDLIDRIKRNPMKRALRCDKMTIAALEAVLRLHADPDRLAARLPVIRFLSRSEDEIAALARRIAPRLETRLAGFAAVEVAPCQSQIGSGSLPVERLPSAALVLDPATAKRGRGAALKRIAAAFRGLPVPVVGRIQDDRFVMDLRCLDDEERFCAQLAHLSFGGDGKQ